MWVILLLIAFPIFMIVDSIFIKWISIKLIDDKITIRRLLRRKKTYNLSIDLQQWLTKSGYAKFSGQGYTLLIWFKNGDFYQIDSSYNRQNYNEIYRIMERKYPHLMQK